MQQRINWSATVEGQETKTQGWCHLIWEGITARPAFKNFRVENNFEAEAQARKFLQDRGVGHYFDFAKLFNVNNNDAILPIPITTPLPEEKVVIKTEATT